MASKASFTADEWHRIVGSPIAAGMAITAAEPSGLVGLLQESFSGGMSLLDAKQNQGTSGLVKAVVDDLATPETRAGVKASLRAKLKVTDFSAMKDAAIAEVGSVAQMLDTKAPEDAQAFKAWLLQVAQRTAEAANEGGFFGIGGVAVSEAEKAAIAQLQAALSRTA